MDILSHVSYRHTSFHTIRAISYTSHHIQTIIQHFITFNASHDILSHVYIILCPFIILFIIIYTSPYCLNQHRSLHHVQYISVFVSHLSVILWSTFIIIFFIRTFYVFKSIMWYFIKRNYHLVSFYHCLCHHVLFKSLSKSWHDTHILCRTSQDISSHVSIILCFFITVNILLYFSHHKTLHNIQHILCIILCPFTTVVSSINHHTILCYVQYITDILSQVYIYHRVSFHHCLCHHLLFSSVSKTSKKTL